MKRNKAKRYAGVIRQKKRGELTRTKALLLAALRLWELKNGYR